VKLLASLEQLLALFFMRRFKQQPLRHNWTVAAVASATR
jgi:hypothetical protein